MSYITQSLHRLIQRAPDALGSIDGDRRRSWRMVMDDVRRFAGALRASGVGEGGRVALLARNGGQYLDFLLGSFWAGAVVNPVNTRWTASEIAASLEDCGTRVLIVDDSFAPMIDAIRRDAPTLEHVVQIGIAERPDGVQKYDDWIAAGLPIDDCRRGGEALAAILYTGGTTGRSKGVMLSHANILASATGYLSFPGARPGRSYLHVAPLFHIGAQSAVYTSLLAGTTHVFLPQFDPEAALAVIEREQVTDVFLVPTMLAAMLIDPGFVPARGQSLQRIVYGASPIDAALLDRAMAMLPGVDFVQAYGMTEVSPIATMLGPDDHGPAARAAGRQRSAGIATIAAEVRVVDPDDREVADGTVGEIVVRGGGVMLGYWELPEATAEALRGGWMHTGDLGTMSAGGYLTVVDRLKDMIVTGGENVYSAEVENALAGHPAVHQAAVIGVADARWGEAVHAVVVLRPDMRCDARDLRDHCRTLIAGYKVPKSIDIVRSLPLSPAGKILKTALRDAARRVPA
ncbi:long-chain-fatty-acid--CoA ligase [uncultured Sphingomonas sp.]|uniref:long-chain-fatty-acid--CoA ligase n=1 Tax=uncultured Sphingomonas sp. TaxID=158754 RepID=UPI0035CBE2A9